MFRFNVNAVQQYLDSISLLWLNDKIQFHDYATMFRFNVITVKMFGFNVLTPTMFMNVQQCLDSKSWLCNNV